MDTAELTHEATLVRGKNYIYKNVHFKEGEPKKITAALAEELEELTVNSRDSRTGDHIEHDRFEIEELGASDKDEDEKEVRTAKTRATRAGKPSRSRSR